MSAGSVSVKSARCVTAGYGEEGRPFGRLVPTEELVEDIGPKRRKGEQHKVVEDVSASFIREKLGIASVAVTHTTDRLTAQALNGGVPARVLFNPDIEAMTTRALRLALDDYARSSGQEQALPHSLAGHIHVSWTGDDRQMFALADHATRWGGTGPVCRRCTSCPAARH